MNSNGNNPYLRAGFYPPAATSHARTPGHGGAHRALSPPTTSYVGAVCPPPPPRRQPCPPPVAMQPCPPPVAMQPCPPVAMDPCPAPAMQPYPPMDEEQLCQLIAVMRSMGQWPHMAHHQPHPTGTYGDAPVIYGVDSGPVPADASARIVVIPQERHIPERLVLDEAMVSGFIINSISAGVTPLLATTDPISAAIFAQDSTSKAVFKPVLMEVGKNLIVNVTNISSAEARFIATVVGRAVPAGF